ncbi:MAG TPA: hypothetical protein VIL47_03045, partial [Candidatus Bipolaricaulota bacterium]
TAATAAWLLKPSSGRMLISSQTDRLGLSQRKQLFLEPHANEGRMPHAMLVCNSLQQVEIGFAEFDGNRFE